MWTVHATAAIKNIILQPPNTDKMTDIGVP